MDLHIDLFDIQNKTYAREAPLPDCVEKDVPGTGHFVLDAGANLTEVVIDSHIDPFDLQKEACDPLSDGTLPLVPSRTPSSRRGHGAATRERTGPAASSGAPVAGKR